VNLAPFKSQQRLALDDFREFAALLPEKFIMGVVMYADESGTHDATGRAQGAEVATVAGFLSRSEHWERFTQKWVEVLDEYRVPAFHMSEFVDEKRGPKKPDWPYKGWARGKRDKFISSLVTVARDNTLVGVCGAVSVKDYDEVVPEQLKKETKHPYHFSLQNFFDNILELFHEDLRLMLLPWEQIAFSFEQQEEFEKHAIEIFHLIKRDADNRMGSIAFVPKGKFRAHEAADLFAYRMRKVITRRIAGIEPAFKPGSWDDQLNARNSLKVGYFQRDNLKAFIAQALRDRQR
jgi:hypothetical protein